MSWVMGQTGRQQVDCSRVEGQQQQKSDRRQWHAATGGRRVDWRLTSAAGLDVSSADQRRTACMKRMKYTNGFYRSFQVNVNLLCRDDTGDHCGGRCCRRRTRHHHYHHLCHCRRRRQVTSLNRCFVVYVIEVCSLSRARQLNDKRSTKFCKSSWFGNDDNKESYAQCSKWHWKYLWTKTVS